MVRETFTFEGKRYDVTAKTKKELAGKIALKKRDLEEGRTVINKTTTVAKWGKEYLTIYKSSSVEIDTYNYLLGFLNNIIIPHIGNMRLVDVYPIHLQKILNSRGGYSKSHCTKVRQFIKGMFSTARLNKLIIEDPSIGLRLPDCEDGSRRQLTPQERKYVLSIAETHEYGLWVLLMLYCGLRPSETSNIKGCHIDLKRRVIFIDGTKSKAAKRYVPIPEILFNKLKELNLRSFDYLFTQKTTGRQITKTSRRCMWQSFTRDINIAMGCRVFRNALVPPYPLAEDLTPYCLRHTFCTDLQDAGVPINIAKELMGHESIETTSKYYTHFSDTAFAMASDLIDKFHLG